MLLQLAAQSDETPNIIMVDDNSIILSDSLDVVEEVMPDANITGFIWPQEAIDYAKANRIDLAILDIEMGNSSGLTLCRTLLEINPTTNVLLFFKRTRKTGAAVLVSYIGVLLFGELLLKHVVTRMRPCQIDQTFAMLVERPTSSSFPSTHSAFAFGTAMAIFMNHRRAGVLMFIVATLVAFSRLYLFVHFPTDVLCGIVLGIAVGFAAARICDFVEKKMQKENS